MTITVLLLLTFQIVFGALDNFLHHEITERLPSRPSARRELALHSAREAIYGLLFLIFAWIEPRGVAAMFVLALLASEVLITMADFIEEDRSRTLPPFERILHTMLAISYGGFLLLVVPWLVGLSARPTGIVATSHGMFSWFFSVAAIGVFAFAIRNAMAVRLLGRMRPPFGTAPFSGRTILVTGATGFIGTRLLSRLLARGDRVIAVSRDVRQARVVLGNAVHHVGSLHELPRETRIDAVVNLAGAPIIGLPWTRSRRSTLRQSRIDATVGLVDWLSTLEHRPAVLVSGSAVGFYGDRGDEVLHEGASSGSGFAAGLCRDWEAAATRACGLGMRVVCLRIGLVLGRDGGALPMMALPVRFGLGATFGAGHQWMSWITRDDLVRMIVSAIDSSDWHGAVNAVAPNPLRHIEFQRALAGCLRRPLLLVIPGSVLRMALGELSSIFLHSQRVVPVRAQALGFRFESEVAECALDAMLQPENRKARGDITPLHSRVAMDEIAVTQDLPTGAIYDPHNHRRAVVTVRPQGAGGAGGKEAGVQA